MVLYPVQGPSGDFQLLWVGWLVEGNIISHIPVGPNPNIESMPSKSRGQVDEWLCYLQSDLFMATLRDAFSDEDKGMQLIFSSQELRSALRRILPNASSGEVNFATVVLGASDFSGCVPLSCSFAVFRVIYLGRKTKVS